MSELNVTTELVRTELVRVFEEEGAEDVAKHTLLHVDTDGAGMERAVAVRVVLGGRVQKEVKGMIRAQPLLLEGQAYIWRVIGDIAEAVRREVRQAPKREEPDQ